MVCIAALWWSTDEDISAVKVTLSRTRMMSVVADVDIRSSLAVVDNFALSIVGSVVPDSSKVGKTLLLLLMVLPEVLLSTEDVEVSVLKLDVFALEKVDCMSALCVTSDDSVPAVVVT